MESNTEFRRRMARFELSKARQLRDAGQADRAAVALRRAKIWRWDALARNPPIQRRLR